MGEGLMWRENPCPADKLADTEFGTLGIRVYMTGEYSVDLYDVDGVHVEEISGGDVGLRGGMILSEEAAERIAALWVDQRRQAEERARTNARQTNG